jgi:DNA-binding Lrp family transcriptional regulator
MVMSASFPAVSRIVDHLDRRLLDRLQADFPPVPRPFAALGEELGLAEEEVLRRVRALQEAGLIRRIGPVLDPGRVGRVGTLAAVAVPPKRLEEVGTTISACQAVTHNYLREPRHGTCPFNLWFTLTAESKDALAKALASLSQAIALPIVALPTRRKFKIGVRFAFAEEDADG